MPLDDAAPRESTRPTGAATLREGAACGRGGLVCRSSLREVCVGGRFCACRPGEARRDSKQRCERVERTPLALRVVTRAEQPLFYSSASYGDQHSPPYLEFAEEFSGSLDRAIADTEYTDRYVTTTISRITHPKTLNSSWDEGEQQFVQHQYGYQLQGCSLTSLSTHDQLRRQSRRVLCLMQSSSRWNAPMAPSAAARCVSPTTSTFSTPVLLERPQAANVVVWIECATRSWAKFALPAKCAAVITVKSEPRRGMLASQSSRGVCRSG